MFIGLAAAVLLALACSGGDDDDRACAGDSECQLLNDCCRCVALNVSAPIPICNIGCGTTRCFTEHGQATLAPRCVAGLCEVAELN